MAVALRLRTTCFAVLLGAAAGGVVSGFASAARASRQESGRGRRSGLAPSRQWLPNAHLLDPQQLVEDARELSLWTFSSRSNRWKAPSPAPPPTSASHYIKDAPAIDLLLTSRESLPDLTDRSLKKFRLAARTKALKSTHALKSTSVGPLRHFVKTARESSSAERRRLPSRDEELSKDAEKDDTAPLADHTAPGRAAQQLAVETSAAASASTSSTRREISGSVEQVEASTSSTTSTSTMFKAFIDFSCMFLPFFMFLAPVSVFYPAYVTKAKVSIPPLPFSSQTLQCFLWLLFAFYLPAEDRLVLIVPNVIGLVLGLLYLGVYPRFVGGHHSGDDLGDVVGAASTLEGAGGPESSYLPQYWRQMKVVGALSCVAVLLAGCYNTLSTTSASPEAGGGVDFFIFIDCIGYLACLIGLLLLTSPLFVMKQAYETRNPALMGSTAMNACSLTCSLVWTIQGAVFLHKTQVTVQNLAGCVANGMALVVRYYLWKNSSLYSEDVFAHVRYGRVSQGTEEGDDETVPGRQMGDGDLDCQLGRVETRTRGKALDDELNLSTSSTASPYEDGGASVLSTVTSASPSSFRNAGSSTSNGHGTRGEAGSWMQRT